MPVLDGYTATREWRDREVLLQSPARLPIVAMTANAMAGDRQRCLDAGMDDYLSKPVSREQLENCLQRWLPGRASFAQRAVKPLVGKTPEAPLAAVALPTRPATPTVFPVLDHSMLDELQEIAGDETVRIIGLFLEDAPRLIGRLETASTVPDLEAMRDAAHTLKSSSANVGAMALSTAAKRVELGARAMKLDRPAVAVALVIAEYARARMALQGYVAQLNRDADLADSVFELGQQVIRFADAVDERQLGFDPVDVLFLRIQDVGEQLAADVVADAFAVGDGFAQQRQRLVFQRQVALQHFARVLADAQLAQHLEVGQAVQEQDALGQFVRMLHLVDGFLVLVLAPVP